MKAEAPVLQMEKAPDIYWTSSGTPYLRDAGAAPISIPSFYPAAVAPFIESFGGDTFEAAAYVDDFYVENRIDEFKLSDADAVAKFAGQLCYLSFGEGRTKNDEAKKYMDNIKAQYHGSVFEHANMTFLFWGIDRSVTHELVRHRAGFGYSQVSQRYVSGKTLRFVSRPEHRDSDKLQARFERWIDLAREEYDERAELLKQVINTENLSKTEARKAVNQAARACLPNETEAPIVVTANVRAWRHFLEMRASKHADRPIRGLAMKTYRSLARIAPLLFDDYVESDDHTSVDTKFRKV